METITASIVAVFGAIREFFGYSRERVALKNAADVKQAAKAQDAADLDGKTNLAIKNKDTDEIRLELSE